MRPRKKKSNLPKCMYFKHGSYYHVVGGKWHRLSKDYEEAIAIYARRTSPRGGMDALLDKTLESLNVKPNTLSQYQMAAERIKAAFFDFAPDQVRSSDIARFLDHYEKTPNMANRMRTVLRLAFKRAVRWELAESNPVIGIDPFEEKQRKRYITDEEYLAIRAQARPYIKLMMDLAYLTGQRIGDVISLKRSQIRDGEIYFEQQKTEQKMTVAINPSIRTALDRAGALREVKGIYLFHTGRGKKYSYFTVRDAFKKACVKAGVEDAQLRDIRAKSATDAEEAGLNPGILLGHQDAKTTKRYLRKKRTIRAVGPESIRQTDRQILDS